jgi:hypothetical protein
VKSIIQLCEKESVIGIKDAGNKEMMNGKKMTRIEMVFIFMLEGKRNWKKKFHTEVRLSCLKLVNSLIN